MSAETQPIQLALPDGAVSALLQVPPSPRAGFVFAHGAGAGMEHPFMAQVAAGLVDRGVAVLRYNFPFMDRGSRRPDPPGVAHAAVRAAVTQAAERLSGTPLFAGGKSFGGRMSSQAQAATPMPGVRGLVFLGFPLHPAGKPSKARADHLQDIDIPMLFLQGSRDALADPDLVRQVVAGIGTRATLHMVDGMDHAFHVLARSGRSDSAVLDECLDRMADWMTALA